MLAIAPSALLPAFREASPPRTPGQGPMTDINYTFRACCMLANKPAGATHRCKHLRPTYSAGGRA